MRLYCPDEKYLIYLYIYLVDHLLINHSLINGTIVQYNLTYKPIYDIDIIYKTIADNNQNHNLNIHSNQSI